MSTEPQYNISTRKIQIFVNSSNKDEVNKHYGILRFYADECVKAANFIVNQQHLNFHIKERIKLYRPDINLKYEIIDTELLELEKEYKTIKDKERKNEIKNLKQNLFQQKKDLDKSLEDLEKQFYVQSGTVLKTKSGNKNKGDETSNPRRSSIYQLLTSKFKHIPTYILNSLGDVVSKSYQKDYKEVLRGTKTVRTYRNKFVPFQKQAIRNLQLNVEKQEFEFSFLSIPIITNLGRDRSDNYSIIEKIISGEYLLCDSSIIIKDNKFFISFVIKSPQINISDLSDKISVGVDLGIKIPVFVTSSNDKWGTFFGNIKSLSHKKQAFKRQRQSLQRTISESNIGGHGYKTKMRKLNDLSSIEKNYTLTLLHTFAKNVVDYAIKQGAGVIKMEFMEGINEEDSKLKPMVRFWSPRKLQTLIEEKANKYNIQVLYVDPHHTSQTCSSCDHFEEGQRDKRDYFICKNPLCSKVGKKQHADRNASLNICNSTKYVQDKKDCQIYKIKNKEKQEV